MIHNYRWRPGLAEGEPSGGAGLEELAFLFWTYTCINWLRTLPFADQQFEIEFLDAGVQAYVFTFG